MTSLDALSQIEAIMQELTGLRDEVREAIRHALETADEARRAELLRQISAR